MSCSGNNLELAKSLPFELWINQCRYTIVSKDGKYLGIVNSSSGVVVLQEISAAVDDRQCFVVAEITGTDTSFCPVCFAGPENSIVVLKTLKNFGKQLFQEITVQGVRRRCFGSTDVFEKAWCIDGNTDVIVVGTSSSVLVVAYATGELIQKFKTLSTIDMIKVSAQGGLVATSYSKGAYCSVHTLLGKFVGAIPLDFLPRDVCFTTLNDIVIAGFRFVKCFDVESGTEICAMHNPRASICSIAYAEGKLFFSDATLHRMRVIKL